MLNPLYKHSGALSIATVLYLTTTTPHALPGTERHLIAQDVISRSAIGRGIVRSHHRSSARCTSLTSCPLLLTSVAGKPYMASCTRYEGNVSCVASGLAPDVALCACVVGHYSTWQTSCTRYNSARIACTRTCQSPHTRSSTILPSGVIRNTSS